jgi:hypothetical protein
MAAVLKTLRISRHDWRSTVWLQSEGAARSCDDRSDRFRGFPNIDRKLVAVGRRLYWPVISLTMTSPIKLRACGTYEAASWKLEVACSDRSSVARDRSVAISSRELIGMLPDKQLYIAHVMRQSTAEKPRSGPGTKYGGVDARLTNDTRANSANNRRYLRGSPYLPFLLVPVQYINSH